MAPQLTLLVFTNWNHAAFHVSSRKKSKEFRTLKSYYECKVQSMNEKFEELNLGTTRSH